MDEMDEKITKDVKSKYGPETIAALTPLLPIAGSYWSLGWIVGGLRLSLSSSVLIRHRSNLREDARGTN